MRQVHYRRSVLSSRVSGGRRMEAAVEQMLGEYEHGTMSRRQLIQGLSALAMSVAPSAAGQTRQERFRPSGINHLSFQVADYARTRDFYADLLGMRVANDDPATKQSQLFAGDSFIFVRTARPGRVPPMIDHFAIGLADWDKGRVETELKRRKIQYAPDRQLPNDSFHLRDPDGYDLQVINDKVRG